MPALSVAIPTYRREQVLIDTIRYLLPLIGQGDELLVVDQTPRHGPEVEAQLSAWQQDGAIRWLRRAEPSIPKAMNQALLAARHPVVVFFDDDIRPEPDIMDAFRQAVAERPGDLIAGRVIQPWEEGMDFRSLPPSRFAGLHAGARTEFMGGNFALPRTEALRLGGFDENFVRVAYRFEAEFAHRWLRAGRAIWFAPRATIHHLKAGDGGTRTFGEHLATAQPDHAVGAYYYALRTRVGAALVVALLGRLGRSVATRYHLRHPWRVPTTLLAEVRGLAWALRLARQGPAYAAPVDGDPFG